MADATDRILARALEVLAETQDLKGPQEVAGWLTAGDGDPAWEVTSRISFYTALRKLVKKKDPDPSSILELIRAGAGKELLGGHASVAAQTADFFKDEAQAGRLVRRLLEGARPPKADRIDAFVDAAVDLAFHDPAGKPASSNAAVFTSALLTAAFPDDFPDFRPDRWLRFAEHFELGEYPHKVPYGELLVWAGSAAKRLSSTPTFRKYFASSTPANWTVSGLCFQFAAYRNLEEALSVARGPSVWIFQAVPEKYDLVKALRTKKTEVWTLPKYKDKVQPGDFVFLWESGQNAGVVGLAHITEVLPEEENERPVVIAHDREVSPRVPKSRLMTVPALKNMLLLKMPQGTVFPVQLREAAALYRLIDDGGGHMDLHGYLGKAGFHFPGWLVTDYVLSLATKPFVLLTGISGTGKTKLAQLVAEHVAPQREETVTAERPDDDGQSALHRVGHSTFRYGVTLPRATLGLFPMLEKGTGINVEVTLSPGAALAHGRINNVGYTALPYTDLMLSWHKDARDWLSTHAEMGDYLRIQPGPEGQEAKLSVELIKPKKTVQTHLSRVAFISARADWTDNRAMLGFFNPLTETYAPTELLRLLLRAIGNPGAPHFVILDEMNLSKVEYYFSDFLSAMESGTDMVLHDAGDQVMMELDGNEVSVPERIKVPNNVFFTGTVNIDETTYMFSPKVLDRANTIEFNEVDLAAYGTGAAPGGGDFLLKADTSLQSLLKYEPASSADYKKLDRKYKDWLAGIHAILARDHLHFAYRVVNEISRYMALAKKHVGADAADTAFDMQILQKILPKLWGSRAKLEAPLWRFLNYLHDQSADPGELTGAALDAIKLSDSRMPRSAAKVKRMLRTLRESGFVSFVE